MNKLSDVIKSYRAWKMKEHGTSNITAKEVKLLRESLNKKTGSLKESTSKLRATRPTSKAAPKSKNVLLERISSYREWKMKEHGIDTVNAKEVRLLKESIVAEKVETNVSKKIHEARVSLVKAKRKLREGDMQGAADMTQMAGDNINAAGDMAAGAPVQLPDNIVTAITNVKTAIDSLATEAGIQSPVDLSGNPEADIPPVDGGVEDPNAATADPNAQAQQLVLESVKARLEAREKRIKENIWDDTQKLQKTLNPDFTQKKPVDTTPSPDTIQIPSTSKLLNGTKDAADTWPTKPISEPSSKKKVKEEEESITNSWADRHVREALEKNTFNWKDWLDSECNLNKR